MAFPRLAVFISLAAISAAPLCGQFFVTVQENAQVVPANNGGSIVFNAPAVGKSVVAAITVTYTGAGNAVFTTPSSILGAPNFAGTAPPVTINSAQSYTFSLTYIPPDSAQEVAQFSWNYNLVATSGVGAGQVTGAGLIAFTLIGNAPNIIIGQTNANNNFVVVPTGGMVLFPDTALNSGSSVGIAISNAGSGPATITSITTSGSGFQLQGLPLLPIVLPAGSQLSVGILFVPTTVGPQSGMLQIGLSSGAYSASLSAKGVTSFLSYQTVQGSASAPLLPNQTIMFPSTNVGGKSSIVIQFQNTASTAAVLSSIGISGVGFAFTDQPFLPATLQSQQTASVTITFTPTQPGQMAGRLFIGNDYFPLSALASGPLLQFSYLAGGATVIVPIGGVISFPPVAVGQTESIQFTSTNTGTAAASEVSIGVVNNNGVFQVSNLPSLPAQIAPNATSAVTISFSPQTTGQSSTSLLIDNQIFTLSGFASAPPALPTYHFTGAVGAQQPFQQPAIGLALDATYPITLNGSLTLTIASSSFSSDPAVQFSSGTRQVAFTIPANTLQAVFPNGSSQIRLQTGTVAGSIAITPDFVVGSTGGSDVTPANPTTLQLTIASTAPTLLTASLSARGTTSFTVTLTGYSTARSLDHLNVTLTPSAGSSLTAATATIDVSAAARAWFLSAVSQSLGGEFTLDLPFSLGNGGTVNSGTDLTKSISSVAVIGVNSLGSSNTVSVVLP